MSHRRRGQLHGARPAGRSRRLASGASASRPRMPPRWRRKPRLRSRPRVSAIRSRRASPMGSPGLPRCGPLLWRTGDLGKVACHRSAGHSGPTTPRASSGADHAPLIKHHRRCDTCPPCPSLLTPCRRSRRTDRPVLDPRLWTDACRQPEPAEVGGEEGDDLWHAPIASLTGQARRYLPAWWRSPRYAPNHGNV